MLSTVCIASLIDEGRTFASSLYTAATEKLVREFGCSCQVLTLGCRCLWLGWWLGLW